MNIATNIWLWALTGRSSNFVDPELNTGVSFGVGCSDMAARARVLLCLNDTRTDFHVIGALHAALDAATFLDLPSAPLTCDCIASSPLLRPTTVTGATPAPSTTKRWPVIRNRPQVLPAPTEFTVSYAGPGAVTIADDTGGRITAECRSSGYLVIVDRLMDVGIESAFLLDSGTWQDGDAFSVFCEPSRYPYAWVASRLAADRELQGYVMSNAGPLAMESPDPFAKVGALALSIIAEQLTRTAGLSVSLVPDVGTPGSGSWSLSNNQLTLDGDGLTFDGDPLTYAE